MILRIVFISKAVILKNLVRPDIMYVQTYTETDKWTDILRTVLFTLKELTDVKMNNTAKFHGKRRTCG